MQMRVHLKSLQLNNSFYYQFLFETLTCSSLQKLKLSFTSGHIYVSSMTVKFYLGISQVFTENKSVQSIFMFYLHLYLFDSPNANFLVFKEHCKINFTKSLARRFRFSK